jgi:hypothetical protein
VKMRRHDEQHFANTGEKNTLQLTMRERLRRTATVVKLHSKTDKEGGKREGRNFREQVQRNSLCIALLFNLFLFLIL